MFVCFGHGILATHQELSALFKTVSQPKRKAGCLAHIDSSETWVVVTTSRHPPDSIINLQ